MNLLVRVPPKSSSCFEVPDASEPQDPRPHPSSQHNAIEKDGALNTPIQSAVIVESYARCPLHGLVI